MIDFKVEHYQELSSTNKFLKDRVRRNEIPEGAVILADYQLNGKGRADNTWYSELGKNLLLSMYFLPNIEVEHHFFITEFISLALIDTFHTYCIQARIKWPNDIYIGDRKLAGILIENSLMGSNIKSSVVGVGVNINQVDFPDGIPNPVSLKEQLHRTIPLDEVLGVFLDKCRDRYEELQTGMLDNLHNYYKQQLYKVGEEITYLSEGTTMTGKLVGVEKTGELMIQNSRGTLLKYLFGEAKMLI